MREMVLDYWMLWTAFAGGAVLWVAFVATEDAPVARRVFQRFLFNIALPLLVIFGVPLLVIVCALDIDAKLWPAIIAGLVIATGWITTAVFGELGKSRDKAEKLRDYHKAIYAEIGSTLGTLYADGHAEEDAKAVLDRMQADKEFIPMIPQEHHDFVYGALIEHIDVLPRVTIDAIVAYYSLVKSLAAQAEDMRGPLLRDAGMTQDRRMQMYKDYFETRKNAFQMGEYTRELIRAYSDGGPDAVEKFASSRDLNTPGAALSGRLKGSE